MGWGDEATAKYFEIMEPARLLSAEAFSLGPHMLSSYLSGLSSLDTKGSESLLFLLGPHLYHTTNLTGLLESQIPNAVIWMVNLSTLGFGRDTRESRTCQSYSTVYVCVVFFVWLVSFFFVLLQQNI